MQSVSNYMLMNKKPFISITHKGLSAIKEIVKIAPEEAQWFHTVEPIVYKHSPNEIHLHLSEKIYIPTQNTSVAQVDTTASMMMDFYKELKEEYKDQTIVNQKLSAMTCWCHSHHNMSPNPSNQDDLQFNQFVNLSIDQNTKTWQIMLIFNKKDQFYSRVYDPETGNIHEGVPIEILADYNFDYIHEAAKSKFKKKKKWVKAAPYMFGGQTFALSTDIQKPLQSYSQSKPDSNSVNDFLAEDFLNVAYPKYTDENFPAKLKNKPALKSFKLALNDMLDESELCLLFKLLTANKNSIKKTFKQVLDYRQEASFYDYIKQSKQIADVQIENILNYMKTTTKTISDIHAAVSNAISLNELDSTREFDIFMEDY